VGKRLSNYEVSIVDYTGSSSVNLPVSHPLFSSTYSQSLKHEYVSL
jgi:hypothetical protein